MDASVDAGTDAGTNVNMDASSSTDAGSDASAMVCQAGSVTQCSCSAGAGVKTCNPTGTGYGACTCPNLDASTQDAGSDGSTSADAGTSDASIDASTSDAGIDASTHDAAIDAATADAGTDGAVADAGSTTSACDLSGVWSVATTVSDAAQLNGVWGFGSADNAVWVVGTSSSTGKALIGHYDGSQWTSTTVGQAGDVLYAVWGVDPANVFAVGSGGAMYRYLNLSWVSISSPTSADLHAMWGTDPSHYWVVGAGGAAFFWDGQAWNNASVTDGPTDHIGSFEGIWGGAIDNVWVTNYTGGTGANTYAVHHYTAAAGFMPESSTAGGNYQQAIWGASVGDIWAVGYNKGPAAHYDDTMIWTGVSAPINGWLRGVWGRNGSQVWAVGDLGQIDFWDGSKWSACQPVTQLALSSVVGTYSKLWAVGAGGIVLRND